VDHVILINKLEAAGVRGVALKWFQSYLSNRKQQAKIKSCLSSPQAVEAGVPTSATLFLIFINDLLKVNFHGKISAFADDIAFFYSNKNTTILANLMSEDLLLLSNWCSINKMQVNVDKTKFINFGFSDFDLPLPLKYHSNTCNSPQHHCICQEIEKVTDITIWALYWITGYHGKTTF